MIDINELRKLVHRYAKAALSIPIKPAMLSELLDRLEEAEAEALEQARLNGMGSEREAALMAKLEAAEKSDAESIAMYRRARDERDALRAKVEEMGQDLSEFCYAAAVGAFARSADTIKVLQAKIEAMEKQEPHSYIYRYWNPLDGSPVWRHEPGNWNGQQPGACAPLYALPGAQAQPEPSVPENKK